MANTWTTADLVNDVLLYGHVPGVSNVTFTPTNILRIAQYEIQTPITKQILSSRGGYYLTYDDYTIVSDGLYQIPSGAIGGGLANVEQVQGPTIIPVNLIEESEQFSTISPTSTSYGFFMKGNYVQILPTPNLGVVRLWYFKRTSNLVLTTKAAQITAITGLVISTSFVPPNYAVGNVIEFQGDQPPFNSYGGAVITAISGGDITVDVVPTTVSIGDWVAQDGQTPIPQIPIEWRMPLIQRVIVQLWQIQGSVEKAKAAQEKVKEYESAAMNIITQRVKSQTKVINPQNGGFFQGGRGRSWNFPAGRSS